MYYAGADCAIIMFDVTSRLTYRNVPMWYRDLKRVCGDIPILLCGNKVDVKHQQRQVKPKQVVFHRKTGITYYEISAKSNYNFEKPFIHFARKLLQDNGVNFVNTHALLPPEVTVDSEQLRRNEIELNEALSIPLPNNE